MGGLHSIPPSPQVKIKCVATPSLPMGPPNHKHFEILISCSGKLAHLLPDLCAGQKCFLGS